MPLLRKLFREAPEGPEKQVREIIRWITATHVTKSQIDQKAADRMARTRPRVTQAVERILGKDRGEIVIRYNSSAERQALVRKLGSLVDLHQDASRPRSERDLPRTSPSDGSSR